MWWIVGYIVFILLVVGFGTLVEMRKQDRKRKESITRHGWWRWRWSQDGWVRRCKICHAIQYGGDDYDGGPDVEGRVVPG